MDLYSELLFMVYKHKPRIYKRIKFKHVFQNSEKEKYNLLYYTIISHIAIVYIIINWKK